MKYYKDNQNNVFAYSDIQTPKDGLTKITEQEALELTNPPKSQEELKLERKEEILADLNRLDAKSARPMRAMLADTATDEDKKVLAEMEEEAKKLREELAGADLVQQQSVEMLEY